MSEFSTAVIRRTMECSGMRLRRAVPKPSLTAQHCRARLLFAKEFVNRPVSFWRSIYFADETLLKAENMTYRPTIICGPGFPSKRPPIVGKTQFPARRLYWLAIKYDANVRWKAISGQLNSEKFIQVVKESFACELRRSSTGKLIILQDNAPCHTSKMVRSIHHSTRQC
ncbi:hypothetical protein [Streptococcus dysgalactiae]|uniref:hypothetical protein n=1 Tax=Streptococcus dysgalactiae TaxID=1334 RepID=UPI003D7BE07C